MTLGTSRREGGGRGKEGRKKEGHGEETAQAENCRWMDSLKFRGRGRCCGHSVCPREKRRVPENFALISHDLFLLEKWHAP